MNQSNQSKKIVQYSTSRHYCCSDNWRCYYCCYCCWCCCCFCCWFCCWCCRWCCCWCYCWCCCWCCCCFCCCCCWCWCCLLYCKLLLYIIYCTISSRLWVVLKNKLRESSKRTSSQYSTVQYNRRVWKNAISHDYLRTWSTRMTQPCVACVIEVFP